MAAKKESVATCAGPLQYGVGRPDGANTMIKTLQYLAEADPSQSLLRLTSMLPCRMVFSIEQNDADLAAVFSKWYTGTTEHRMHYDSAYTKISANSGVGQGCPLSTCGFSAAIDPVLRSVLADICRQHDPCQALCLPGRLVRLDQAAVLATNICPHCSSHQISQP